MSYAEKLSMPEWHKRRMEIINRDRSQCQLCGDCQTILQVHHKYYMAVEPWEYPDDALITYCKECHDLVEFCKARAHLLPIRVINSNHPHQVKYMLAFFKDKYATRVAIVTRGIIGFNIGVNISERVMRQIMDVFNELKNG